MKKLLAALLLTLPTISVAIDFDGFYITPKAGVSKSIATEIVGSVSRSAASNFFMSLGVGTQRK